MIILSAIPVRDDDIYLIGVLLQSALIDMHFKTAIIVVHSIVEIGRYVHAYGPVHLERIMFPVLTQDDHNTSISRSGVFNKPGHGGNVVSGNRRTANPPEMASKFPSLLCLG